MNNLIFWIDRLNTKTVFKSLFLSLRLKKDCEIRYFVCPKKFYLPLIKFIFSLFGKNIELTEFSYDLSLKDPSDHEALFWHVIRDFSAFGEQVVRMSGIDNLIFDKSPFQDRATLSLFLKRQIAYDYEKILGIFRIAHCHKKQEGEPNREHIVLAAGHPYQKYLSLWAERFGLSVDCYALKNELIWAWLRIFYIFYQIISNFFLSLFNFQNQKEVEAKTPKVGVFYAQGINLERRSDLFWFNASHIKGEDVVIYFIDPSKPPSPADMAIMQKNGFDWFCLFPKAKKVKPGFYRNYVKNLTPLLKGCFKLWFSLRQAPLRFWLLDRHIWLLTRTAFFQSLFESYNIRVHFGLYSEKDQNLMALHLACQRLEAIDIYMHWSNHPVEQIMPAADVYFTWGPFYNFFYKRFAHGFNHLIYCGYLYDDKFLFLKNLGKKYRKEFIRDGVKFVLCFFDNAYFEGGWFKREVLIDCYLKLLTEVKRNKDWAIVLKPKRPETLAVTLTPEIKSMIDELISDNRCKILDHKEFPAAAASMSDLVVGFGAFSTPVIEASLMGIKSIGFDPSHHCSYPLFKIGTNKIIFEDIEDMLKHIRNSASHFYQDTDFGNHSFILSEIDPFQDGKAAERIGRYMQNFLKEAGKGLSKAEALKSTNDFYRRVYGDNISHFAASSEPNPFEKINVGL